MDRLILGLGNVGDTVVPRREKDSSYFSCGYR